MLRRLWCRLAHFDVWRCIGSTVDREYVMECQRCFEIYRVVIRNE